MTLLYVEFSTFSFSSSVTGQLLASSHAWTCFDLGWIGSNERSEYNRENQHVLGSDIAADHSLHLYLVLNQRVR